MVIFIAKKITIIAHFFYHDYVFKDTIYDKDVKILSFKDFVFFIFYTLLNTFPLFLQSSSSSSQT